MRPILSPKTADGILASSYHLFPIRHSCKVVFSITLQLYAILIFETLVRQIELRFFFHFILYILSTCPVLCQCAQRQLCRRLSEPTFWLCA